MVKNIWQCHENKAWSRRLIYIKCKTGWENNQSGCDSHKGIQDSYIDRFSQKSSFFSNITSEDSHRTDTKTQSKECLIHSTYNCFDHAYFFHAFHIRNQVKAQAFFCSGHGKTVDGKNYHNRQKCNHHYFCNFFQSVLKTHGADKDSNHYYQNHPECHHQRLTQHLRKYTCYLFCVHSLKFSGGSKIKIVKHPACNGSVKHHQKITADQCDVSMDMPLLSGFFQYLIRSYRTFLASTSHCKLHGHNRNTQGN